MKKFLQASCIAAALALGGCASTGGGVSPNLPTQAQSLVDQVKAYVQQSCGFIAQANDIALVISAFYPQAAPVAGAVAVVGNAICKAPSAPGGGGVAKRVSTPSGTILVRGQ